MSAPNIQNYNAALDAAQAGKLPEALKFIEESLTDDSTDPESWQLYAIILQALGRKEDAEKATARVEEIGISPFDKLVMEAAAAIAEKKPNRAISLYEDALELEPQRAEAHAAYALLLWENDYKKDAWEAAEKAVETDDKNPAALFAHGHLARLRKDPETALKSLSAAVETDHQLATALYEKGMVLDHLGRPEEALECFRAFLKSHPEDEQTLKAIKIVQEKL